MTDDLLFLVLRLWAATHPGAHYATRRDNLY